MKTVTMGMAGARSMVGAVTLALGGLAVQASGQVLLIDDFTTGAGAVTVASTGLAQRTWSAANILGGTRCVVFGVSGNEFGRQATADIRDGHLLVETSAGTSHASFLLYGYGTECEAVGLDLDLSEESGLTGFRLDFRAVDLDTAGAVVIFTDAGNASIALGVTAGADVSKYVAFADFLGDADWHHVQEIGFVIESGGVVEAHDYVLKSISAVTQP